MKDEKHTDERKRQRLINNDILPLLRDFFADGTIPFFGRYGSIDVHDTTSGSADSGIGLYLLLLLLEEDQNMIENMVRLFRRFSLFFVFGEMDIHNNDKEDKHVSGHKTREELWISSSQRYKMKSTFSQRLSSARGKESPFLFRDFPAAGVKKYVS